MLVSSHLLGEVEQVCDWSIVIERGAGIYAGPAAEFLGGGEPAARGRARARRRPRPRSTCSSPPRGSTSSGRRTQLIVCPRPGREPRRLAADLNRLAHEHGIVLAGLQPRRSEPRGPATWNSSGPGKEKSRDRDHRP